MPTNEPLVTLEPTLDTYIDLMKVDGIVTANVSPRHIDDKLMIKTSGGQTTIRLTILEFYKSQVIGPKSAAIQVVGKDINGDSTIRVYGFDQPFNDAVVWGDLFSADSRISDKNTEVMEYLNHFGTLTGEATIQAKDPNNLDIMN